MRERVSGTWVGQYRYDPPVTLFPVPFQLMLKQTWLGRFSGTVSDGDGGMPELGTVSGWVRRGRISFTKLMPVLRVAADTGTLPFHEHAAKSGWAVEADTRHPPILYEGSLSDDGRRAEGIWRVEAWTLPVLGQLRAFEFPRFSGTWSAQHAGA